VFWTSMDYTRQRALVNINKHSPRLRALPPKLHPLSRLEFSPLPSDHLTTSPLLPTPFYHAVASYRQ
jgi:hypothetical protein